MEDTDDQYHCHETTPSRLCLRHARGEIVEVQGGHIVRSIGRKDRHSKVCTSKGPRDRRVRLSALTAIQFYDVQDRLGYDRPSKAVDWLITKAKASIDELPAWKSTLGSTADMISQQNQKEEPQQFGGAAAVVDGNTLLGAESNYPGENNSSFLPPSMDSDAIKSFFPTAVANSSGTQFQSYPSPDLLSRTSSQSQDLRLSLQSFHDPILLHHHQSANHQNEQALFSGTAGLGYDAPSAAEVSRFQRMIAWNDGGDTNIGGGGGGFVFNSLPAPPLFGHNQFVSQRGPLQSSNTQSIRAWIDPSSIATADHHQHHHGHHLPPPIHPSSLSGISFASFSGFSGFQIPARIQGEEEEHDGVSDKPSSASSDSCH